MFKFQTFVTQHCVAQDTLYISICETRSSILYLLSYHRSGFGAFLLPVLVLAPHIGTFALGIPVGDISMSILLHLWYELIFIIY
jgi:hypothetical protein